MPGYSELHAHSTHSHTDAVPHPHQLIERAAELGLPGMALTDHAGLYGIVPFFAHAADVGVKAIAGSEFALSDGYHLTLLAHNQAGYANLCSLITVARMNARKGEASLPWSALAGRTRGLLCLTGCRQGPIAARVLKRKENEARRILDELVNLFGRLHVYVELQRHHRPGDVALTRKLAEIAKAHRLPVVATGNVHYLSPDDALLQDVLVSVRARKPLSRAGKELRPNHEYYLRSPAAMSALYADLPEALWATLEITARCHVVLPNGLQTLPVFPTPGDIPAIDYLRQLCAAELPKRYRHSLTRAHSWLDKELTIIEQLGMANYFLILADIICYCEARGILAHGRGSAANSLVAYLLRISGINPIAQGLVLERFISVERGGTPDVDIDLPSGERREEVLQYVYARYGRDRAAMASTHITWRSASAVRDVGYALGLKQDAVEVIARRLEHQHHAEQVDEDGRIEVPDMPLTGEAVSESGLSDEEQSRLLALAHGLKGGVRHLGLHPGAMILSGPPLSRLIPIEPATMEGRSVVQWDKYSLEDCGIVKIDLLGLRMLGAVSDTLTLIESTTGKRVDLHSLGLNDPKVYALIASARTIGVFQVESPSQISFITRLHIRNFNFLLLTIILSMIRPGPLQAGMVAPFVRRYNGDEPVTFWHPSLKPVLAETLGILVWQEQVIKIAEAFAGFSPGRGEKLRRALGAKNAPDAIEQFKKDFFKGAIDKGVDRETILTVWNAIKGFGGYAFAKSHAASFAVITYWSAWLKVYYPVQYFCALLNNAPLGSYPVRSYEAEARRVGVRFLPFDVNASQVDLSIEKGQIRHTLKDVQGLGAERAAAIVQARSDGRYRSLADFVQRTKITDRRILESLIQSGAMDDFGERRQLAWELTQVLRRASQPQLAFELPETPQESVTLPALNSAQRTMATFAATGYTVDMHLASLKQAEFKQAGCLSFAELQQAKVGMRVRVGGLISIGLRRPGSANGVSFIQLETDDYVLDVIVPIEVYAVDWETLRHARFYLIADGVLQRPWPNVTVVAQRVFSIIEALARHNS